MIPKKQNLNKDINNFVFNWDLFPLDYWWRKKYNIPFGSKKHREMSFIDMAIEWKEEKIIENVMNPKQKDDYIGNAKVTAKEIDEDYENLDLSQFNN